MESLSKSIEDEVTELSNQLIAVSSENSEPVEVILNSTASNDKKKRLLLKLIDAENLSQNKKGFVSILPCKQVLGF